MSEKNDKILELVKQLKTKEFKTYFLVLDTKGNQVASMANIYDMALELKNQGYNVGILHEEETESYTGVGDWLGDDYMNLDHISIKSGNLMIAPTDLIVIPEIFPNVMDSVKKINCNKVVISQSYKYVLDVLPMGKSWSADYGITEVITTSEMQSKYLKSLFVGIDTHIIEPFISDVFKPKEIKNPTISIHTREPEDTIRIVKEFYLKYPMFKWVTFEDMRGFSKDIFADKLGKSAISVWVDNKSSFGTFPLESIECGTPVIARVPNKMPSWAYKGDGELSDSTIWCTDDLEIVDNIAALFTKWVEDSIPVNILEDLNNDKGRFNKDKFEKSVGDVFKAITDNRVNYLESLLEKKLEKNED